MRRLLGDFPHAKFEYHGVTRGSFAGMALHGHTKAPTGKFHDYESQIHLRLSAIAHT